VPPGELLLNVDVRPAHILVLPAIVAGNGLTVTVTVRKQPVGKVYVIVEVPPLLPVTIPLPEPIPAIEELLEVHVPPAVLSVNAVVCPTQIAVAPMIASGSGFTVTVVVAEQPALVYIIGTLQLPNKPPLTTPPDVTVAHKVLPLVQVPPVVASLNVVENPAHITVLPVIGAGVRLTVIVVVAMQPVPIE
jgi:hypothetical protein